MSVTRAPAVSSDDAIDSTGVMPDPAATSTCSPTADGPGVNVPAGGCTSTTSPGLTSRTSQLETRPPATSRTPMRGGLPGGTQIEYERRSVPRWTVSDWPGLKANSPAMPSGTSNVIAAASSVSGSTAATVSG